jgi:hypothetical protein
MEVVPSDAWLGLLQSRFSVVPKGIGVSATRRRTPDASFAPDLSTVPRPQALSKADSMRRQSGGAWVRLLMLLVVAAPFAVVGPAY